MILIQSVEPFAGFPGSRPVACGLEILGHLLQLFPRLIPPGRGPKQVNQHAPNFLAAGELVRKQLHRLEGLIQLAQRVHALQELDQVPFGLTYHVLAGVELTELQVGLSPAGVYPEDLATERYGVVEEALVSVEVDRPFIRPDGFGGVVDLEVEVAYPVIEREIGSGFRTRFGLLNGLQVDFDGFSPILLLFQLPCRVFQLFQIHAARG